MPRFLPKPDGAMLAIDTNIIVRLLINDDPRKTVQAQTLFGEHDILILSTVLLEAEWVLRSAYGMDRIAIIQALTSVAGLPQVTFEQPERVARALTWSAEGMDFADALHLAGAEGNEGFVTFDRRLAKLAKATDSVGVRAP